MICKNQWKWKLKILEIVMGMITNAWCISRSECINNRWQRWDNYKMINLRCSKWLCKNRILDVASKVNKISIREVIHKCSHFTTGMRCHPTMSSNRIIIRIKHTWTMKIVKVRTWYMNLSQWIKSKSRVDLKNQAQSLLRKRKLNRNVKKKKRVRKNLKTSKLKEILIKKASSSKFRRVAIAQNIKESALIILKCQVRQSKCLSKRIMIVSRVSKWLNGQSLTPCLRIDQLK